MVFYFYFLIHGFRDEAFFYKAHGDMPSGGGKTHARIMVVLQVLMLGLLLSLAIPAYVFFGEIKPEFSHPVLANLFPADWNYFVVPEKPLLRRRWCRGDAATRVVRAAKPARQTRRTRQARRAARGERPPGVCGGCRRPRPG